MSGSFGLLHGFGFASALGEIGLPQSEVPAALLAFNAGVEIGQILFVALIVLLSWIVMALLRAADQSQLSGEVQLAQFMQHLEKPVAFVIGGITTMWTLERFSVFWA